MFLHINENGICFQSDLLEATMDSKLVVSLLLIVVTLRFRKVYMDKKRGK
jgi:hypothetical protein